MWLRQVVLACLFGAALSSCASVPGETLASGGIKREVSGRVLAQANAAHPACKSQRIVDTEVLELHPDAKVAAELWTVEHCGERSKYRVIFPASGLAAGILVRPD